MRNKVPESFIKNTIAPHCNNDPHIINAFRIIPRSRFMDDALARFAYDDNAQPIGFGQTISKPSTVALMTYLLAPEPSDKILEIGTGSGFQAAVLSRLVSSVYTVERIPRLYAKASERIRRLFIKNVFFKLTSNSAGWPDEAPFDKIIFTCGAQNIGEDYFRQLKVGGRIVAPIKDKITLFKKTPEGIEKEENKECSFVEYIL
ncbi:protein-L-isoaspartate(D-aspartate) O-methyltransferase [Flexistipes sinusarabici]|uniref:Protein-L-isoaspartate O-methyltransferase n=1 Tax=Flexistipes sinusarabici TaxID=2352 RepID=A0A3D5QB93_FLESI|nr:protein-L-isoaspartate(D-aspartate) O-methyltransferase [Flexistipes sinusarabici]HCW92934.1 protein-L-isoaspartate(D-aspartate) O-methyltransferase [Flexistipes sinusarabici]